MKKISSNLFSQPYQGIAERLCEWINVDFSGNIEEFSAKSGVRSPIVGAFLRGESKPKIETWIILAAYNPAWMIYVLTGKRVEVFRWPSDFSIRLADLEKRTSDIKKGRTSKSTTDRNNERP